jgi:hypothetical protein
MARRKRTSDSITRAQTRAAAIKSIDPKLDLGKGLTLAAYEAVIAAANTKLASYNTKLSEVDELLNQLETDEEKIDDLSERMLGGIGAAYGKDSDEYEKAGGTKKSERKKPARKPKA